MGENAQTAVPTFTASQVLTAAQMNESARTGVPVFATTVERDAAFGGAGEKTLAEGQLAYLESTNVVQYYDGAAWATVGPSTGSGANFVLAQSFSAVASVSMAAGTFTSTYQNYLVMLQITANSTGQVTSMRVNNAGTPRTGGNYSGAKVSTQTGGTVTGTGTSGGTSFNFGASGTGGGGFAFSVYSPQVAATQTTWSYTGFGINQAITDNAAISGACKYDVAEANDGLTFLVGGTITGNLRVYGLADS